MTATPSRRMPLRAAPGLIELPLPPLTLPTAENAYRLGEPVLITYNDGTRVPGALLAFRPERGNVFVRLESATAVDAQAIPLNDIRTVHLLRDRRMAHLSTTLDVRGKVVMPPTRQEFEVVLNDDERLSGHTYGFRIDQSGLHLYPAQENGAYTHLFISAHAIRTQRVGPLLGEALVAEELVTYDTLAAELMAQHKLRERPIGEYLVSACLVTAKELEAALEEQRTTPQVRLGEILVREGIITDAQLAEALRQQEHNRRMPLGEMLVAAGIVSAEGVTQTLAKKLGIPFVDLDEFAVDLRAVARLDEALARQHKAIPLYVQDGRMVVAMENPAQWQAVEALRRCVNMEVDAVMATSTDIAWAINKYYEELRAEADQA